MQDLSDGVVAVLLAGIHKGSHTLAAAGDDPHLLRQATRAPRHTHHRRRHPRLCEGREGESATEAGAAAGYGGGGDWRSKSL